MTQEIDIDYIKLQQFLTGKSSARAIRDAYRLNRSHKALFHLIDKKETACLPTKNFET
jgi:hypothetical protein